MWYPLKVKSVEKKQEVTIVAEGSFPEGALIEVYAQEQYPGQSEQEWRAARRGQVERELKRELIVKIEELRLARCHARDLEATNARLTQSVIASDNDNHDLKNRLGEKATQNETLRRIINEKDTQGDKDREGFRLAKADLQHWKDRGDKAVSQLAVTIQDLDRAQRQNRQLQIGLDAMERYGDEMEKKVSALQKHISTLLSTDGLKRFGPLDI